MVLLCIYDGLGIIVGDGLLSEDLLFSFDTEPILFLSITKCLKK